MHVTKLPWCDFVVWSPVDDPFVKRVYYDSEFMKEVISKARSFYFNTYLPSIVPCVIISNDTDHFESVEDVMLSGEAQAMDNVKPCDEPCDGVKLSDKVKSVDHVKLLDSAKGTESVKLSDNAKSMEGVKAAFHDTMLQVVTSCKRKTMPLHLV